MPRVAFILGSTNPGRTSEPVARLVLERRGEVTTLRLTRLPVAATLRSHRHD